MHIAASRVGSNALPPALPRARGRANVSFRRDDGGRTRVTDFYQSGCLKVRLPRSHSPDAELVVMNISGGLTGGDRLSVEVAVGEGASATVTTPACEHIYRSTGEDAVIDQRLRVERAGRLDWIPQETIIFNQGRMRRRLQIDLDDDAEITIAEAVIFGRTAMGETVTEGGLSDVWTVRRGPRLLYADAVRITQPVAEGLHRVTNLNGHRAFASLLHAGTDLAAKLEALRAAFSLSPSCRAGASIIGDVLVARLAAPFGASLRHVIIPALACLRAPHPLPRLWSC